MADTSVGGITGFLDLDDSRWDRTIAKVKGQARELGTLNPDIKVDADTAVAQERIALLHAAVRELGSESVTVDVSVVERAGGSGAVAAASQNAAQAQRQVRAAQDEAARSAEKAAAAESALAVAVEASETATRRAMVAQMRLDEVRGNSRAAASRVAAAELALDVAIGRSDAAARKATAAEEALAEAQTAAAASANAEAAAQTGNAAASSTAGSASSGASKQTMLMVGAIVAIISLLGPATAGLVAFGGAAIGMGSAGVLAVLGIKNAMQQGTATGQEYSAGLTALKGDLDDLSSTAAIGMLQSFDAAQQAISSRMPELNAQVSELTGYLGRTGTNFLEGTLNGMEVAMPLFRQGAAIIERWSEGFESWTTNGGLQRFVNYAQAELPRVATALENVAEDAVEVAKDLAPIGDAILDISSGVHGLFELQKGLDGVHDSLAKSDNGGGNFLSTVWTAAEGALNPVTGLSNALTNVQPVIDYFTGATGEAVAASNDAAAAAAREKATKEAVSGSYGMSVSAYNAATSAAKESSAQSEAATRAMQLENDAAGLLNNALTLLNGGALSVAQAQTGLASAVNSTKDSFKDNKNEIDGNSKAAVANQQAIQSAVQAADQMAQAQATATGSTKAGVEAYKQSKTALEDALRAQGSLTPAVQAYIDKLYDIDNLKVKPTALEVDTTQGQLGITAIKEAIKSVPDKHDTKANALVDEAKQRIADLQGNLNNLPPEKRTEMKALIDDAKRQLVILQAQIDGMHGKELTITQRTVLVQEAVNSGASRGVAGAAFNAHGGTAGVDGFAHGGSIVQRFAAGGTSGGSVWGSSGSAYNDKVPTWLSIGEEVVQARAAAYPGARSVVKAINANPANAMQAIAQRDSGGGDIKVTVVNKTGMSLSDLIDIKVERAAQRRVSSIKAGRRQ